MTDRKTIPTITCAIRCMDPATVEAASGRLVPAGVAWVPYTCKLSGARESILLIGDELATEIMKTLPAAVDLSGTRILASLYSAELCECDVATVTGAAEPVVVTRLQEFASTGIIAHRMIQGMNYYRLVSDAIRRSIREAVDTPG